MAKLNKTVSALKNHGFTLVELMVVLTVAGILAAIAVPSFNALMQGQQVKNASFSLIPSLTIARSEAIKRNANVTLTPNNTSNWGLGWVIRAADGTLIKTEAVLKGVAIAVSGTPATVVYNKNGRVSNAVSFQIDVYGTTIPTDNVRCVKIELSGMPRSVKGVC